MPASKPERKHARVHVTEQVELTSGTGARGKILVVDDEPAIVDVLVQALAESGYTSLGCCHSLRVYDSVCAFHPDLILLDVLMPYLEADDQLILISMNPETRGIPAILVTAIGKYIQDMARYRSLGVVDSIWKPFPFDDLLAKVASALNRN